MKSLRIVFLGLCFALAVYLGVAVFQIVSNYGRVLTSFPLCYIIIGQLLFGLLGYLALGLAYALIRFFVKRRRLQNRDAA